MLHLHYYLKNTQQYRNYKINLGKTILFRNVFFPFLINLIFQHFNTNLL